MKISLIIHTFYPAWIAGGPIYSTLNTSKELAKIGVETYVSTSDLDCTKTLGIKSNKWFELQNNIFVKYYSEIAIGRFSISWRQLLFLWKDMQTTDVVHIQGIFNTTVPIGLFYAKMLKKPTVLSPRGTLGIWCLQGGSKFKKMWLRLFISPIANKITWHATSKQEYDEIKNLYPFANIKIISNGINLDEYKNINILTKNQFMYKYTKKDLSPSKILVSMGRIQKKKGFDILIQAFQKVLFEFPSAVLLIAGDEENKKENEKRNLENLIKEYDLENHVFFTGMLNGQDKINFLANADLFVLPSHNENFGNVYVESLAAGTPIIASTNTPWQEVEVFNCGKWVENSIQQNTSAILELLNEDRKKLRDNSRQYAIKYSWITIAKNMKELYALSIKKGIKNV